MPNVALTIESTDKTVRRPVIQSVATDVMANFGLGTTFSLHYSGTDDAEDLEVVDGTTRHGLGFFENTRIILTAETEYVENSRSATVHALNENKPVFTDDALGILISPNYARVKTTLSFQVRCNDKNGAAALRSRIRQLFHIDNRGLYHDVRYMYLIPLKIESLLTEIYTLRERQGGYGDTQDEYYSEHFAEDVDIVSNQGGGTKQLAVREMQNRILGSYDFQITPDKPDVTDGKRYVLNFSYEFEYDEPLSLNVKYPLIAHNQLISPRFFDAAIPYEPGMIPSRPSQTLSALDYYTTNNIITEPSKGVPVPIINDWLPKGHPPSLIGIARIIVICDEEHPYETINLANMDDIEFNPETLAFIKDNRDKITQYRRTPIYITLYKDEQRMPDDAIHIAEDLTVYTKEPMSVRSRYNLWVAAYEDLVTLGDADIETLRIHPEFTEGVLLAQAPELSLPPPDRSKSTQLPSRRSDGVLVKKELIDVIYKIHEKKVPRRQEFDYSRRNVGFYLITAKRSQ